MFRGATARRLALVAAGGICGALARYGVGLVIPGPGGTLLANVTGAFALGLLASVAGSAAAVSRRTRLLLGTGFLSSYTTYSTFAVESARAGSAVALVGVVLATYVLGFAAAALGVAIGRRLLTRRGVSP